MFLNNKPTRLGPASKARLNANAHTNPHKLDTMENRNKKSPDGNPPTPTSPSQPSEVLVFNNTTHHGGSSRAAHYNRSLPEVPNYEEIEKFMKDSWDERIRRINDPSLNLKVLWIKSFAEEEKERLAAESASASAASKPRVSSQSSTSSCSSTSQSPTPPKKKGSPNHKK